MLPEDLDVENDLLKTIIEFLQFSYQFQIDENKRAGNDVAPVSCIAVLYYFRILLLYHNVCYSI